MIYQIPKEQLRNICNFSATNQKSHLVEQGSKLPTCNKIHDGTSQLVWTSCVGRSTFQVCMG
jgi:hypothetical protein